MENFISTETFATVAGAAGIVIVVFNTIRTVFGWGPKWFGLLLSIVLSFLGIMIIGESTNGNGISSATEILITILNGFVIFASAFSIQNIILNNASKGEGLKTLSTDRKYNWTTQW